MTKTRIFSRRTRINAPVTEVFSWHARPGALERLIPPWDNLQVINRQGGIEVGARTLLKMWAGPIPFLWQAEHTGFAENAFFQDIQTKGPFAVWVHNHDFTADGENACFLEDRIQYRLPLPPVGDLILDRMIRKNLERTFRYRHATTARDLKTHARYGNKKPLNILVSGASGLIGSALVPFLTTGGHKIIKLVRRQPINSDEIFWDPPNGRIALKNSDCKIDAVIHLAGENIGQGRWTEDKKKRIILSRIRSTGLLAEAVSRLPRPPEIFLCASATGYYGDRGDTLITEQDDPGAGFLAEVCTAWEKAAKPARQKMRTAFLRIGVVLTPKGGALARLLPPFRFGLGGKLGNGSQYMSWIGIDDVLGAIHHALITPDIEGPLNVVSPEPMPNREFTKALADILKRPAALTLPAGLIKRIFGEMGREVLLAGTRVKPEKLLATGYEFRYPHLAGLLSHVLGIESKK